MLDMELTRFTERLTAFAMSNLNRIFIVGLAVTVGCFQHNRGHAVGFKTVAAKTQPLTLVSTDAALCNVDAITYGKTQPGDAIFCDWYRGDGQVWRGQSGAANISDSSITTSPGAKTLTGERSTTRLMPSGSKKKPKN